MSFYLTLQQSHYAHIPEVPNSDSGAEPDDHIRELQICLAEALHDIESILADPTAFPEQELTRLRHQIVSNLEGAWEITGSSKDELAVMIAQISRVAAKRREQNPS